MQCASHGNIKKKIVGKLEVGESNSVNEKWGKIINSSQLTWNSPGFSTEIVNLRKSLSLMQTGMVGHCSW